MEIMEFYGNTKRKTTLFYLKQKKYNFSQQCLSRILDYFVYYFCRNNAIYSENLSKINTFQNETLKIYTLLLVEHGDLIAKKRFYNKTSFN